MKKILAAALMLVSAIAHAQSYPSPTYNNVTVQGALNLTNGLPLTSLAPQASNTVIGNATGASAKPTAITVTGCNGAAQALQWTNGSGFGCNSNIATSGANSNITALTGLTTALTVAQGGTGAATASAALANLGGAALSGATFTGPISATAITGTPISGSTGSFTTLSASGTVSGSGFSTYLASPPAIGGTAPNSGAFSSLSATTANPSFNYLTSLTGGVARTYTSKLGDWSSVRDFGATGNGSTNDGPAILTASTAGPVIIPPGTYLVSVSIVLPNAVQFMPGAKLSIASGQTVTFSGPLIAGVGQIFSGAGAVSIAAGFTTTGYPEWWGAVTGSGGSDNSPAINSCIVAVTVCQLQAAQYQTIGTILMQTNNRALMGASPDIIGTGGSTFIVNSSGTANIMQVGPNTYSGTFQNTAIIKNILFQRSTAPVNSGSPPVGLLVQYTVWVAVNNVISQDSTIGFEILGCANLFYDKDFALRATAYTGGADKFYGFWLNAATNIGGAGGTESAYISNSGTSSTVTWSSSIDYQGFVASGTYGYSDIFLTHFATANLGYGIDLVGNGSTSSTFDNLNEDVRIYDPILDSVGIAGIQFNGTSLYGAIQVIGGYINFIPGASSPVGINYINSNGGIFVTGVQVMCQQNTTGKGMTATSSRGIISIANNYFECKGVPVTLSGVTNSRFEDQIRAYSLGSTGVPAVQISSSSSHLIIRNQVEGAASAYSQGFYLSDSTTSYSEFNATGLVNSAIADPSKILNNGTGVSTVGAFGTSNYATGVMN